MIQPNLSIDARLAEQAKISANWVQRLRECMTEGDQPQILNDALRAARISESDIIQKQNIRHEQVDQAVQDILPKVPDITLRMFARAELTDLGVLGYAAMNSDTVGRAMSFMIRYHGLTSDRYSDRLDVDGDVAAIVPIPVLSHISELNNVAEDSLTGNWRALHLLMGSNVDYRRASLHFAFSPPPYARTFHEIFDCSVHFNAERNELRFPAVWLDRPIATANQSMSDVCKAMCERLLGASESSRETPQMVRRLLLSRPGRKMYRLEEAADVLNLSVAQLRKRLYKAGTSYKKLVLEIRMALARHYLAETDLPIQEIAYLLDYSQPAPFSRAYKAYFGEPPEKSRRAELRGSLNVM